MFHLNKDRQKISIELTQFPETMSTFNIQVKDKQLHNVNKEHTANVRILL